MRLSELILKYDLDLIKKKEKETMEKELQQKLEEIAFRLQRLTDDYHELLNELSQVDEVKKSKKVIYEQYVTQKSEMGNYYRLKSSFNGRDRLINYVRYYKGKLLSGNITHYELLYISKFTTKIIETYIPSKNLVMVVEL